MEETTVLSGMKEYGFPMANLLGVWESDKDLIKEWRKKYISER